ncbi:hypothetical protein C2845_PM07G13700 [Panicum miliaceum]|uniref:Uncharacterized protein n=1 Tax=Panicum miliaceum TaxID=4540 RepID=A0A3L6SNY1_PANMI|nr:hypothetical protein C2845_PM07G13700 [Panicum miliaceum]
MRSRRFGVSVAVVKSLANQESRRRQPEDRRPEEKSTVAKDPNNGDKPHTHKDVRSSHPFAKEQEINTRAVIAGAGEEAAETPYSPWTAFKEEEASVADAAASTTVTFNSAGAPEQQKKQRGLPRRHSTLTLATS